MRNWERHFPDFDVPRFVDFLVDKGVLADDSEDGDDGPNFDNKGITAALFVTHPLRSLRESVTLGDEGRFVILRYDDAGDVVARFDTDDLEEALIRVFESDQVAGFDILEPFAKEYQAKMNEERGDQPRTS